VTELPPRWDWLWRGFRKYVRRYLHKHFTAVRLSKQSCALPNDAAPILVVLNHPSWWDPLIAVALADLFAGFTHFAAIDAAMLKKYRVFARLGFFGIDMKSLEGARTFLRTGSAILLHDRHAVWVTAQGEFADVRKRPLGLKPGVGHLAARSERGWVVPIAIEYAFWDEKKPEALARIGEAFPMVGEGNAKAWSRLIESRLTETLDALNTEAMVRDPSLFSILIGSESK